MLFTLEQTIKLNKMPTNTIQISYNGKYENANFVVTDFNTTSKKSPVSFFSDEKESYLTFELEFQEVNHCASFKLFLDEQTKNSYPEKYNIHLFTSLHHKGDTILEGVITSENVEGAIEIREDFDFVILLPKVNLEEIIGSTNLSFWYV